jgi:hypothetical protein
MKPFTRPFSLLLAACICGLPLAARAAGCPELERFLGTWQSSGNFVDSPYSKASAATATTACDWSTDRLFMICQQSVTQNGTTQDDLGIYSCDEAANAYHFYNVRPSQGASVTLTIEGKTVTYMSSVSDNGNAVMIRTLNVWDGPSQYHWRTEYSTNGGSAWTLMASGVSQLR